MITATSVEGMSWKTALGIGLVQCLSMIPGVSRSGATIMGALTLGVERKTAAEFSFFLAVPTMIAATGYDLLKTWDTLAVDDLRSVSGAAIRPVAATRSAIEAAINRVHRIDADDEDVTAVVVDDTAGEDLASIREVTEDATIVKLANLLIRQAVQESPRYAAR